MSWQTTACKPGIYVSSSPAYLQVKDSPRISLKTFIESRCQSIFKEFKPAWWLFNGHLQTAYCVIGDFSTIDQIVYERRLLRVPDGGTIGLDFTAPSAQKELDPDTPIVVVLHGSYESYVRSVLSFACSSKEQGGLGYRGVVVNFRGCAGVEMTTTQFYSAGYTDDFRRALLYLSIRYPRAKLLGIGFSLGANVMTRYLGEEGANSKLASGCVLACPWDLVKNSKHWFSRSVYSKAMANNLRALVKRHLASLLRLGPSILTPNLETLMLTKGARLIDVDELLTRLVGGSSPPFPFPSAKAYYEWASSHHYVKDIRVPFLAINSLDDPIVREVPVPVPQEAGYTTIVVTRFGGHLGWFQRNKNRGIRAVDRWVKAPVCEWLEATGNDLVVEFREGEVVEEVDGFTRSAAGPHIGYKEIGLSKVIATAARGTLGGL
ncbi:AB-hydrolase YheT [Gautieria morchelliformis]|nr:AB-hydrolase YheT [Gautieria morchelliformis]